MYVGERTPSHHIKALSSSGADAGYRATSETRQLDGERPLRLLRRFRCAAPDTGALNLLLNQIIVDAVACGH